MISPLYGGNVGSVCRAMANTGMNDLAIANPRKLDEKEARMMACAARDILDSRTEYATFADSIADCVEVVCTSARVGLYRSHSTTPKRAANDILKSAETGKVALVFGPEDCGMTNEDLALATKILQIPTSPVNTSLNLSQAAMVCCYELFTATGEFHPTEEKSPRATSEFRERMFDIWRETLLEIGFMKDDKSDHMMLGLRRVLSRGNLSVDDVKIMMGIAKQAQWASCRRRESDALEAEGI